MGATNGLKSLAVGITLFALGFGSGFPLLFRLGYAVVALALLSFIWTLVNIVGLDLRRETRAQRAEVGQTVEEAFSLRNSLFIPKLWLECRDYSTLPDHHASRAFDMGPRQRRSWIVSTRCRHRGRYLFGPVTIATGDPFGLFRLRRRWREQREIIVYPSTVELPRLSVPLGRLSGGAILHGHTHYVTPNSLGVREYQPGDALNRIHWPSTARLGALTVKEFEADPAADIWLVLDVEAGVQAGSGDESTEEYGIKIAASLARHYLQQHRAVGLIADGGFRSVLPADRGDRQLTKVLELLAVLSATGRRPLAELLASEAIRFNSKSVLLVLTPSQKTDWVNALWRGPNARTRAVAVWLDAGSFRRPAQAESVPAISLPYFVVRQGQDIAGELTSPRGGA